MKILFVDIDGTLTETISGNAFKQSPQDIKLIDGASKAIAAYVTEGWLPIGISNQGGVGAGYKSLAETIEEMANTLQMLPELQKIYFCPDFDGEELYFVSRTDCDRIILPSDFPSCRKPFPGMIKHFLSSAISPIEEALMVGDRPEDEQCAIASAIDFLSANEWWQRF